MLYGLAGAALDQHLVVAGDRVGDVAERARRRAVGEHHDVAAGEDVAGEVGDHAAVGDLQARAVVVERPRHGHRQAVLPGEVDAERLAVALGLVVAGPRAGAGDVAAVVFGRRDVAGSRVAVDLAAGEEQEAPHGRPALPALRAGVVEQVAQAVDVGVHRPDRVAAVVGRRGDRRGVDDVLEVAAGRAGSGCAMSCSQQREVRGRRAAASSHAGTPRRKLSTTVSGSGGRAAPLRSSSSDRLDEVVAEEPAPPVMSRFEPSMAANSSRSAAAMRVEVALEQLPERLHRRRPWPLGRRRRPRRPRSPSTSLPGRLAARVDVLQELPLLERVHAGPEAVVRVGDQLSLRGQPLERLLHEVLALADVVEDLAAQHEEAAVDAHADVPDVADAAARGRSSSACTRWKLLVGATPTKQAVADLGAGRTRSCPGWTRRDRPSRSWPGTSPGPRRNGCTALEPLPDVRVQAGVDEGDLPVLDVAGQQLHRLAAVREHEVVGDRLVVVEEVVLDGVGLVAEAEDEVLVPVVGVVAHHVPQDRPVADGHHRLGHGLRELAQPHARARRRRSLPSSCSPHSAMRRPHARAPPPPGACQAASCGGDAR